MTDERTPGAEPPPSPAPTPPPATGGTSTGTLMNIARGAKGLALLFFLLPWVTVSCAGQPFMRISGLNLATGSMPAPTGLPQGMGGAAAAPSGSPDIFVLAAAVLIVLSLVATFVLARRTGALAAMAGCAVALALIVFTVFVRIKGEVTGRVGESSTATAPTGADGEFARQAQQQAEQMAQAITVDPAAGFWLTALALVAAIVLNKMVHGRRTEP